MVKVLKGVVEIYDDRKGWGFIKPDDGSEDVFVHYSSVVTDGHRTLNEGDKVSFVVVEMNDSRQARDVRKIE